MDLNSRWYLPNESSHYFRIYYGCSNEEMNEILCLEAINNFPYRRKDIYNHKGIIHFFNDIKYLSDKNEYPSVISFGVMKFNTFYSSIVPISDHELVAMGNVYLFNHMSIEVHRLMSTDIDSLYINIQDDETMERIFGNNRYMISLFKKYKSREETFPHFTCTLPF